MARWYNWRATALWRMIRVLLSRQVGGEGGYLKSRSQFQLALPLRGPAPSCAPHAGGHTPRDLPIQIPPSAWPLSRKRHLFTAMVFYGSLVQLARHCPLANDPSASVAPSWRRGWDLNPRCRCQHTCSPGTPNRPLSHLSAPSVIKERGILARDPSSGKAGQPRNVSPA